MEVVKVVQRGPGGNRTPVSFLGVLTPKLEEWLLQFIRKSAVLGRAKILHGIIKFPGLSGTHTVPPQKPLLL